MIPRFVRRFAAVLMAGTAGVAFTAPAQAQANYPDRPIKMLVAYAPGGPTDIYARLVAKGMQDHFKQNVIVENKPGAGATIGMAALAQTPPDGYTISMQGLAYVGPTFHKSTPFDINKDFEIIGTSYITSFFLAVNASLPIRNLKELFDYAKANPDKMNMAAGTNSGLLLGHMLNHVGGSKMVPVAYKGNAPALNAILANEVQIMFDQYATLRPHVIAGKLRIIGHTGDARTPSAPDVPTFAELGYPQFTYVSASTFITRAGTPAPIVAKLNEALRAVVATPAVSDRLKADGLEPAMMTLAEAKTAAQKDIAFWAEAARVANFKPE